MVLHQVHPFQASTFVAVATLAFTIGEFGVVFGIPVPVKPQHPHSLIAQQLRLFGGNNKNEQQNVDAVDDEISGVRGLLGSNRPLGGLGEMNMKMNDAREEEEEELELEHLKNPEKIEKETTSVPTTSTTSISPESVVQSLNVKRPENEEKPAISDNANSLKFPHHNPDGFDESLLTKKKNVNVMKFQPLLTEQQDPLMAMGGAGGENNNNDVVNGLVGFGGIMDEVPSSPYVKQYGNGNGYDQSQFDTSSTTPQDIAEYIFWTGDERGVETVMEEFLERGLVSSDEIIRFLEEVARDLALLRARYDIPQGHGKVNKNMNMIHNMMNPLVNRVPDSTSTSAFSKRENLYMYPPSSYPYVPVPVPVTGGAGTDDTLLDYSYYDDKIPRGNSMSVSESSGSNNNNLLRESALENVIFHLGKNLFAEYLKNNKQSSGKASSLLPLSLPSSSSTQEFAEFIDSLDSNKNKGMPKELEKEVLETLIEAYVDALDEHQKKQAEKEQKSKKFNELENELKAEKTKVEEEKVKKMPK